MFGYIAAIGNYAKQLSAGLLNIYVRDSMQHKVCTLSVVYLYNFRGNVLYETQHSLSQTDCTKNRIFWSIVVDKFTQLFSAPVGVIEMKFSQVPSQQQSRNPTLLSQSGNCKTISSVVLTQYQRV